MKHPYLGPEYSNDQVEYELRKWPFEYHKMNDTVKQSARLLADGNVIGWFQGRLEFGPRALGNRCILGNPADEKAKDGVNKIKGRELWRPLAPAILEEHLDDWFKDAAPSPFMTLSFPFREHRKKEAPAVVHVDGTARLQTVNRETNQRFYDLIKEFEKLTSLPIIINTSFNKKGEPIVCSPQDALDTFNRMQLEYLIINDFLVKKRKS
jgi:carbamoyltransferase